MMSSRAGESRFWWMVGGWWSVELCFRLRILGPVCGLRLLWSFWVVSIWSWFLSCHHRRRHRLRRMFGLRSRRLCGLRLVTAVVERSFGVWTLALCGRWRFADAADNVWFLVDTEGSQVLLVSLDVLLSLRFQGFRFVHSEGTFRI